MHLIVLQYVSFSSVKLRSLSNGLLLSFNVNQQLSRAIVLLVAFKFFLIFVCIYLCNVQGFFLFQSWHLFVKLIQLN